MPHPTTEARKRPPLSSPPMPHLQRGGYGTGDCRAAARRRTATAAESCTNRFLPCYWARMTQAARGISPLPDAAMDFVLFRCRTR